MSNVIWVDPRSESAFLVREIPESGMIDEEAMFFLVSGYNVVALSQLKPGDEVWLDGALHVVKPIHGENNIGCCILFNTRRKHAGVVSGYTSYYSSHMVGFHKPVLTPAPIDFGDPACTCAQCTAPLVRP